MGLRVTHVKSLSRYHMNFLKKHAPISFYIFRLLFLPIFLEPTCFNYTTEVAVGVEKNYVCIGISMNFVLHGFFGHFVMWVTLCLSILLCLCFSLILSGRMQMKSFVVHPCSPPWVNAVVSHSLGWPGGSRCPLATSDEELQWSGE